MATHYCMMCPRCRCGCPLCARCACSTSIVTEQFKQLEGLLQPATLIQFDHVVEEDVEPRPETD